MPPALARLAIYPLPQGGQQRPRAAGVFSLAGLETGVASAGLPLQCCTPAPSCGS